jgi:hypothetical protein
MAALGTLPYFFSEFSASNAVQNVQGTRDVRPPCPSPACKCLRVCCVCARALLTCPQEGSTVPPVFGGSSSYLVQRAVEAGGAVLREWVQGGTSAAGSLARLLDALQAAPRNLFGLLTLLATALPAPEGQVERLQDSSAGCTRGVRAVWMQRLEQETERMVPVLLELTQTASRPLFVLLLRVLTAACDLSSAFCQRLLTALLDRLARSHTVPNQLFSLSLYSISYLSRSLQATCQPLLDRREGERGEPTSGVYRDAAATVCVHHPRPLLPPARRPRLHGVGVRRLSSVAQMGKDMRPIFDEPRSAISVVLPLLSAWRFAPYVLAFISGLLEVLLS